MAHRTPSKIEGVLSILSDMEKDLDGLLAQVGGMKKLMVSLAKDEADKAKGEVANELSKLAEKALKEAKEEAEREAEKILSKGEEELKELKRRVEEAFEEAVSLVVKAALGE